MKTMINLGLYIALLGRLENLDYKKTFTTFSDKNQDKNIQSIIRGKITNPSFGNPDGVQLYTVTFCDGSSHDYAQMWIQTDVEFDLAEEYKL